MVLGNQLQIRRTLPKKGATAAFFFGANYRRYTAFKWQRRVTPL